MDLGRISRAVPRFQPFIAQLQQAIAQRKNQILGAANTQRAAIRTQSATKKQTIRAAYNDLTKRINVISAQARRDISTDIARQRKVIQESLERQKSAVQNAVESEAQRLGSEATKLSKAVVQAAQPKKDMKDELGRTQAKRVNDEVARQAQKARQQGASKAATYRSGDQERIQSQQNAVMQVAEQQAQEIEKTAPGLLHFVQEQVNGIGTTFAEQADRVSTEITTTAPQAQASIRSLKEATQQQMEQGVQTALQSLGRLEHDALGQLDKLELAALAQARKLVPEIFPQLDAVTQAAIDQVDNASQESHSKIEAAAVEAIAKQVKGPNDTTGIQAAITQTAAAHEKILAQTFSAMQTLTSSSSKEQDNIVSQALTGVARIEEKARAGGGKVTHHARVSTTSLRSKTNEGFQMTLQGVRGQATSMTSQALGKLSESVTKTTAEFDKSFQKSQEALVNGVTQGLEKNNQTLSELDSKMTAAADKAAAEYDRPAWQKFLIAVGKFVLTLALVVVLVFVVALAIVGIAALLAWAGIGAGIAFATALAIAKIVVVVGFIVYEYVQRLEAYKKEHGPVDSIWKALGISAALLGISIASITGIPQIIEGIMGHRFFSNIQLSSQEKYDLIVGGVFQLVLLGFAFTRPGRAFFRGLDERVGRFVDGLFEGKKAPKVEVPTPKPSGTPEEIGRAIGESVRQQATGKMQSIAKQISDLNMSQRDAATAATAAVKALGLRLFEVSMGDGSTVLSSVQPGKGMPVLVVRPNGSVFYAGADITITGDLKNPVAITNIVPR